MHTFILVRVINNLLSHEMRGINWSSIALQQRNSVHANIMYSTPTTTHNTTQKRVDLYKHFYSNRRWQNR